MSHHDELPAWRDADLALRTARRTEDAETRHHWRADVAYARLKARDPHLYRQAIEQDQATALAIGANLSQSAAIERAFVAFAYHLAASRDRQDAPGRAIP